MEPSWINSSQTALPRTTRKTRIRSGSSSLIHFLYQHSLPFVGLIVVLLIFPSPYLVLGLVGVLAFLALRWLGNGSSFPFGKRGEASSPFPLTPVNGALLILFAMLAVGLLRSSAPDRGISTAAHALAGLVVLIAIYDWAQSPARAWLVVAGLVALGVGFALTAPVTTDWAGDKLFQWSGFYEGNWPRLSKLSNSNNVAGGLEVAVPLALALIASGKRGLRIWGRARAAAAARHAHSAPIARRAVCRSAGVERLRDAPSPLALAADPPRAARGSRAE